MTEALSGDVGASRTRAEIVAEVRAHIADDRSVVLVGESGIGKTHLLAAAAPTDRVCFAGGGLRALSDHPYIAVGRAFGQLGLTGDTEAVARRVSDLVGDGVLIVDDLHDADLPSVDVLAATAGRITVLAAAWPDDSVRGPVVARLQRAGFARIDVGPLTADEAHDLAAHVLGPQWSDAVDDLVGRSGGIPLLLEELARGDAGPSLPGTIRARLSALTPSARDAALDLAVSGKPVPSSDVDAEDADALVRVGIARSAGPGTWVVRHALVGDAVIASSGRTRVAESHLRCVTRTDDPDEQVAHLLAAGAVGAAREVARAAASRAGSERERIRWAARAATLAIDDADSSAGEASVALLDVADALVRLGESAAHTKLLRECSAALDPHDLDAGSAARLHWHLGRGAWESSEAELAQSHIAAGLELVYGSGSDIEAALLTVSVRFALLSGVELPGSAQRLDRAEQIVARSGLGRGHLLGTRALVAHFAGRSDAAQLFEAAAAAARTAGDTDMELRAATNAITAGETQGDRSHVLALATEYMDYAARLGLGDWESQFAAYAANVQYHFGDYPGALRSLDRMEALALDPWTQEMGVGIRMQCLIDLGQLDEVSALFGTDVASHLNAADSSRRVLMAWAALWEGRADVALQLASSGDTSAHGWLAPYFAVVAAWACDDLGRPVEAAVPADAQLLPITRPLVTELDALRVLASNPSASADLLAAASAASRDYSFGQAVRQAWGAAEAARRAGRDDAVELLLAVEDEAVEAGLAPILARARRSLRLAGVVRTSERTIDRTSLVSPREREVLGLVAAGLTNNEIARRLGVGRPTVRRLTDRARAKLGARDRVEAAAMLAAQERPRLPWRVSSAGPRADAALPVLALSIQICKSPVSAHIAARENLVTSHTDRVAPVLIVGAGLSGLATALGLALQGRSSILFEASDMVGGAAAWSGGQVWVGANHVEEREGIDDDLARAESYVRAIAHAHPELLDDQALTRWLTTAPEAMRYWEGVGAIRWEVIPDLADYHDYAPGALGAGRYLTSAAVDGSVLGDWRDRLLVSPYFPVGMSYADMYLKGRRATNVAAGADEVEEEDAEIADHAGIPAFGRTDPRQRATGGTDDLLTFGTGVVAAFLARLLREDAVSIRLSTPVTALRQDADGRVTGVVAAGADGPEQHDGPVVLATSSFDWSPDLVDELLGLGSDDFGSIAPTSIRGDGITLARSMGADVVRVPATSVPMPPGWRTADGLGFANGPEYALPHAMIVDSSGRRFCDDSYWVDIVRKGLDPDDRHLPFFLVWDEQHHRSYGLGSARPGEPYPDGLVTSAPTLEELGTALGIDGRQLARTAERFSVHARDGRDPDFGRGEVPFIIRFAGDPTHEPNPVLGDIVEPPFHGLRLVFVGTGIGMSGVRIDADAHVLDSSGALIPGLHAVGSCAAYTSMGSGYNSGFALGRGLTHAYLVARELGAQRS